MARKDLAIVIISVLGAVLLTIAIWKKPRPAPPVPPQAEGESPLTTGERVLGWLSWALALMGIDLARYSRNPTDVYFDLGVVVIAAVIGLKAFTRKSRVLLAVTGLILTAVAVYATDLLDIESRRLVGYAYMSLGLVVYTIGSRAWISQHLRGAVVIGLFSGVFWVQAQPVMAAFWLAYALVPLVVWVVAPALIRRFKRT
ncbi:MAG TPA: hypothetical protein VGK74_16005 [Symbiobacteriaceae bacterium]